MTFHTKRFKLTSFLPIDGVSIFRAATTWLSDDAWHTRPAQTSSHLSMGGLGRYLTIFAQSVYFHQMGDLRESEGVSLLFQLLAQTKIKAFGSMALPADKVMMVVIGFGQLVKAAAVFKGNPLNDADPLKRFQGAVDGDQIACREVCLVSQRRR